MIKLNKNVPFLLVLFGILICGLNYGTANANPIDTPPSFEEKFTEVGYKSVEESVNEFANHLKVDVKLPTIMPPITFTHKFGRFYRDKKYSMNDSLEIIYVNKDIRNNIYKIDIRPLKNKINFKGKEYALKDGSKGIYFEHLYLNFLVFEKNNLQYILGIHKNVSNIEIPETLVRIANSIE
ncbi:carbon monoxide dehydrogenase [Viridibacillus sp. FSL R5-0477]|uniref:carbon monoxide dehydrogenase n=1 Tax=Viridibacillus TaxID=496496 RepID=UPI001F34B403|nr:MULTISPECIES: carbon monoxide dehydrogenase [Viridibacillus]